MERKSRPYVIRLMKLTLQSRLLVDWDQTQKLSATTKAFNATANWQAAEAFRLKTVNKVKLQQLYYRRLREDLKPSALMAISFIAQVCEAYSRNKSKRPRFKKYASVPYDQRLMSFKGVDRAFLLALGGRIIVPVIMGKYQSERFNGKHGQYDLIGRKDGKWFLLVTVDLSDRTPTPTNDFIGIDLCVENIATDSDGDRFSGDRVERVRQKNQNQRQALQQAVAMAGIPVVAAASQYTSQTRSQCGHKEKASRKSPSGFQYRRCRFETRADYNGAPNVRARALVDAPMVWEWSFAKTA
jgi:putative transposase